MPSATKDVSVKPSFTTAAAASIVNPPENTAK